MKRRFIELEKVSIYSDFHIKDGDSFVVNKERDGNDTAYHKQGIEIIKGIVSEGRKIIPILVYENDDNDYILLDGFKRCRAYMELGYQYVEAFVCSYVEYQGKVEIPYHGKKMRAWHGGQDYEIFGLYEGMAGEEKDEILYWGGDVEGLRIELAENIQIHWSSYGRYRLSLGRRDFVKLAKAISKI